MSDDPHSNPMIGRRIGAYRLTNEIGKGGMGAVYMAERVDGEFVQTVAIKLIKRGMDTDRILQRFRRERQILASLNHPNVAHFLGGGSTEDGLPYFVMEYIEGRPLYKYSDSEMLDIRERLVLFRKICWAVAAAHELKVVHRDIKPSNIMVRGDGEPKLLDFGIAKVFDPDLYSTDGDPTATHMRAMTPLYASPEQLSGGSVSYPTDVYSLGVILFELLTGHRPFRSGSSENDPRSGQRDHPTNPSSAINHDSDLVPRNGDEITLESIFAARRTSPEALRSALIGDLDKIILKTLRTEPENRYRSVMDLADDITNYLNGKPAKAEFFVTRSSINKITGASIAILPFSVLTHPESSDTSGEFAGIGLADALISRLSSFKRIQVRPTTSVLGFAGVGAAEASKALKVDFILDGNLRLAGSRIRLSVQLYSVAKGSAEWARSFDSALVDVLELEDHLSKQVAESLLLKLTEEEKGQLGRRATNNIEAYEAYLRGRHLWSRFTDRTLLQAVTEFERAIELDPQYALPYIGLADYYSWAAIFGELPSQEAFPKAQEAARTALEIDETMGEAYAALAFTVLLYDWNWYDAEFLARRAIELSPNHPFSHECYANVLLSQGNFDEGIREILKAESLDPVSPRSILMSGWVFYLARRYRESVDKARKALEMQPEMPQGLLHLGNALTGLGELDEAVEVLRRSAEFWSRSGVPRYMLAFARAEQNNSQAVQSILDKVMTTAATGYMKPYFVAMTLVAAGKTDEAFEWFDRAVDERNEWLVWFATEPKLDPLRKDERYRKILERTGNPVSDRQRSPSDSFPNTAERERSIAVLPFSIISQSDTEDTEDRYLSIGLADATTARLSNVKRFVVRPTSSVLSFAGREIDPHSAGIQLDVEFILSGILRRMGDRVRVTAQLLDVKENATRWAASFDEFDGDVLELEDLISEQVTRNLLPTLSGEEKMQLEKRGTESADAHEAYLRGRYFWSQFTPDSFAKARTWFERAIRFDPKYALAYVGIADYYTWSWIYGLIPAHEAGPKITEFASTALELDDTLAEAHAAMGLCLSNEGRYDAAEACYRRAIEFNSNYPLAHEWLSSVLTASGRFDEARVELIRAESLDPLSLRPKVLTAWTLYQIGDLEQAEAKARELLKLDPSFMQSHLQLANILLERDQPDEALIHGTAAITIDPVSPLPVYIYCYCAARAGALTKAKARIAEWEAISKERWVPPYFMAMSYASIGDLDDAFKFLDAAVDEKSPWLVWLRTEPKLSSLRGDERFSAILKRCSERLD